jgi:hypothetical protein
MRHVSALLSLKISIDGYEKEAVGGVAEPVSLEPCVDSFNMLNCEEIYP